MEQFALDISPIFDVLLELLATVLMALGTWGITLLSRKLKLSNDSEIRNYLEKALERAVDNATERAREAGKDYTQIEVRHELLRDAAQYIVNRTPDAVKHFNLSPGDVDELVRARLARAPA